jgi:site-specific DNA-methyltransferase (adenine-specific)
MFEQGNIKLLNIDCMEYMRSVPDRYFDLAIVDPPYGIGESGKTNKSRGKLAVAKNYESFAGDDIESPNEEYFKELMRVSSNQIIWGANHFANKFPANSSCWIVWNKENGESDFADCELAYTSFESAVRMYTFRWAGMLQGDMKNKEIRIHPTQKPVKLYEWLLSKFSHPDARVLDTHLGSGSSAIAAHYFDVSEFVGCELHKTYYDESVKRFILQTAQETLF